MLDVPVCEVARELRWREQDVHGFEDRNNATLTATQRKKLEAVFATHAARGATPNGSAAHG